MKTKNWKEIERQAFYFMTMYNDTENNIRVHINEDEYIQQISFRWYGKQEHLHIVCTCLKRKPSINAYSVYRKDIRLFEMQDMPLHRMLENFKQWLDYVKCIIEPLVIHC